MIAQFVDPLLLCIIIRMPIRILEPEVASQIAAGEVIERPASVVKELVENALDAGAKTISITIEDAGRKLIEVADDGSGIPADELALAVERHATSKLDRAADLFQIQTLGFRGEALASIGSVSTMTLTSHVASAEVGARLRVEGGKVFLTQPAGAPVGTLVRVENLFYNVPARLKFLKADVTERRLIDNLAARYALAYANVRFSLTQENRPALQTSGNGERREVLGALFGVDAARLMLEVISTDETARINGFISPVALTRSNRREMFFFINGRPVQDSAMSAALLKGYHTLLMVGRYPLAALFIEVPPESVDVNVHPTKAEVRFRQPDRIFTSLQAAVRRALLAHNPAPGLQTGGAWNASQPPLRRIDPAWEMSSSAGDDNPNQRWRSGSLDWGEMETAGGGEAEDQSENQPGINGGEPAETGIGGTATPTRQPGLPGPRPSLLRPVGQVANAFLVAEGPDGLYLIDQHAAHERVLFERFLAQKATGIASQTLLQPTPVELTPAAARLLAEQLPLLGALGFQVEPFGPDTFLVRAVPAILMDSDPAAALRVLVENFEEDETPLQAKQEERIIARVCKRAAVKAGMSLSPDEQRVLLADLEACQQPRTCPHGRPTMIHLSVDLLERQFGRKGAR